METEFLNLIIEALEIENRAITLGDHFKKYEEWDSLSQLTLIAELDEQFGVVIKMDDFKTIFTLQELFDWVNAHKD